MNPRRRTAEAAVGMSNKNLGPDGTEDEEQVVEVLGVIELSRLGDDSLLRAIKGKSNTSSK